MTSPTIEGLPASDELKCAREVLQQLTGPERAVIPHYERLSALIKYLDELRDRPVLKELEKPAVSALAATVPLCDPSEWENCYFRLVKHLVYGLVWANEIPNYTEVLWNVYLQHSYTCAKCLRDISLVSADPDLRLAGITELGKWVQALDGHIPFNELLATVVHLLNDTVKDTRESAYALLVFYFARKSAGTRAYLFDEMSKQDMAPNTINRIKTSIEREKAAISGSKAAQMNSSTPSESSNKSSPKPRTPSPPAFPLPESPVSRPGSSDNSSPKNQVQLRGAAKKNSSPGESPIDGGSSPLNSTNSPQVNLKTASDRAEENPEEWNLVTNDPNYKLLSLHDDYGLSDEEFLKFIEGIVPLFEGKETEDNWDKRWQAAADYRRAIRSHYQELSPQAIVQGMRMLRRGFNEAVLTLRTKLTIELCYAIKESVQVFSGNSAVFHDLFDIFLSSLSKVATGTRKITNPPANLAHCVLLMRSNTISRSQFASISTDCRSIRLPTRLAGYFWLRLILIPSLIPSFRSFEADVVSITISAIGDASPEGRSSGRLLLSKLERLWPSAYHKVIPKLSVAALRLIQPKEPVARPVNGAVNKASQIANPKMRSQRVAAVPKIGNHSTLKSSAKPLPGRFVSRVVSPLAAPAGTSAGRAASTGSLSTSSHHSRPVSRCSSLGSRASTPTQPYDELTEPEPEPEPASIPNVGAPHVTSSPITESPADNLSRHIEDLSINNMDVDTDFAQVRTCDISDIPSLDAGRASHQSFSEILPAAGDDNHEPIDLADDTGVICASKTNLESLLRSIAMSSASNTQKFAWFDLILQHSDCASVENLLSCIQKVFQSCTVMSESNCLMELQMLAKDYGLLVKGRTVSTELVDTSSGNPDDQESQMEIEDQTQSSTPQPVTPGPSLSDWSGSLPDSKAPRSLSPQPGIYQDPSKEAHDFFSSNSSQDSLAPQIFPVIPDVCEHFINELVNSVKNGDATASKLVTLTVLLQTIALGDSLDPASQSLLALPVSIWHQRSSDWGATLPQQLLVYLSGPHRTENEALAGLVLLRILLAAKTVEDLPVSSCWSTLQTVASKFQFTNAKISHILTSVYDLLLSCIASGVDAPDCVFQGDVNAGVYVVTQLASRSSEFIAQNEHQIVELSTRALRAPDIRTRARAWQLIKIIYDESASTRDLLATSLSVDERALVSEILQLKS